MEKQVQVLVLKKNIRPVLLDTLAAMYVTSVICFGCIVLISASLIMISAFKKVTFLKQNH